MPRVHVHDAPPPLRAGTEVVPSRRRRNPQPAGKRHRRVLRRARRPRPLPPRPQTLPNRPRTRFLRRQLHLPHQLSRIVPSLFFFHSISYLNLLYCYLKFLFQEFKLNVLTV